MNLVEIIAKHRYKNSKALRYKDYTLSYEQLWGKTEAVRKIITSQKPIIGIFLPNSIEYVVSLFAILKASKTALLINADYKAQEVLALNQSCDVDFIFTSSKYHGYFDAVKDLTVVYLDEIFTDLDDKSDEPWEAPILDGEVSVIIPTSGTTSNQKLVELTHKNLYSNAQAVNNIYHMKEGEVDLLTLPMTSTFCLCVGILNGFMSAIQIIIYDGTILPNKFLRLIREDKVDYFITVPSVLKTLCMFADKDYFDITSLKRVTSGGEKASAADQARFYEVFHDIIMIYGYGMTETSPVIATKTLTDDRYKPDSVGKILEGVEVKIAANGKRCDTGQNGVIYTRGPNVMKGYYKSDVSIIDDDGWLNTGDIGYLDEEGYLYVSGREKNIIITSGQNIYPEEIEGFLMSLDEVQEARVRGIPDESLGEKLVCDLVPTHKEGFDVKVVVDKCKEALTTFKIPKAFYIVDEIEKTGTNKIKRT
jgi:long-chain acyl-CoA synthetase